MEDATVDCLIDETTGNWDAEMLEGVLIPAEAELAKKIPLARSQTEDSLFGLSRQMGNTIASLYIVF